MIAKKSGSVLVTNPVGLHARPAVSWTKLAKNFKSRIQLATNQEGPWVDGKSIVRVLGLKVRQNATIHMQASGEDADAAIIALIKFVETDFDESVADASFP
jgi:phosphocarrier protein HPr